MSMRSIRGCLRFFLAAGVALASALVCAPPADGQAGDSRFVSLEIRASSLEHSKIGTNPVRKVEVYLPAGYAASGKRYPVIYYFSNPLSGFHAEFFEGTMKPVLDKSIAEGVIPPF